MGTEEGAVAPRQAGLETRAPSMAAPAHPTSASVRGLSFLAVPSQISSPYAATRRVEDPPWRADQGSEQAFGSDLPKQYGTTLHGEAMLRVMGVGSAGGYEGDLISRITDYANRCLEMTEGESFDVIHAHDWVTFPAGMVIAAGTGKPLIVHVHSTEFDRSGENVNQPVYDIERQGMHAAAAIIAVSHLTKRIIVERYGIAPDKVRVIHNGIEPKTVAASLPPERPCEKTVLFLGRITMQKGPEFFIHTAAKVLAKYNNVRFIMAGWGDLGPRVIEQVAAMGLGSRFRFTGFLRGREVERAYRAADVYVMPSVSEPFGLTALEAIQYGVPVILSKSSGAAEVISAGAMKCDFWDVDEMANKIVSLLKHRELGEALCRCGAAELLTLTWDSAASQCIALYKEQVEACSN